MGPTVYHSVKTITIYPSIGITSWIFRVKRLRRRLFGRDGNPFLDRLSPSRNHTAKFHKFGV